MKTHKQKRDPLGLSWIGAGMIFLCNPLINIIDILPDFIGLLMIMHGLSKAAEVTDHLGDARDGFAKLAIVSTAQMCIVFTLPFNSSSYIMLMTFTFNVLSTIFFLPAVSHLFAGFSYAALRTGATAPSVVPSRGALRGKNQKYSSVAALQVFTYIAFFARAAGSVLPLIPTIFVSHYVGQGSVDWTEYINILYGISCIVVLAVCLPWLLRFRRYIKGICADRTLTDTLWQKYANEILPNKGYLAAKRTRILLILSTIACGLCFCIYFDYVNMLPGILPVAFLIVVFAYLKQDYKKHALWGIILSVLTGAVSILHEALLIHYTGGLNNYTPDSFAFGVKQAVILYPRIMVVCAAEAIFTIAAFAVLLYLLYRMMDAHIITYTGQFYRTEDQSAAEITRIRKGLRQRMLFTCVIGSIALLLNGAYASLAPWFPAIWILGGLLVGLFTYGMYTVYSFMNENLYARILRNY